MKVVFDVSQIAFKDVNINTISIHNDFKLCNFARLTLKKNILYEPRNTQFRT
jgi:hypothetical protein